jgi:hypothetical protein
MIFCAKRFLKTIITNLFQMQNFKLNLPTDIPWERICVTEDMIDPTMCDDRLPAKWQTSMAVFKYEPEEEFQLYPKYKITYLKVTATITGYQALDDEIQGTINWDGVNVTTLPGLTELLNSYHPCHGAILQVVVGPRTRSRGIPLDKYPFFMDFEPQKRELYELATDTHEKQSRSVESLNITKSGGTTQSTEVLDVDTGGGGFGIQVGLPDKGGGIGYQQSNPNGQWGTKRLNTDQSMTTRSSDVGQEQRETFSFSAQISQMYHLLDSYHLGTNRAVFFIQPRPHTLEEPSGFVRGPRPVEGIQEFFLVVAQPKHQEEFCVSLRLDTSHIIKTPILDYERKTDSSDLASANAPIAYRQDTPAERKKYGRACIPVIGPCWDVYYQCYVTNAVDDKFYQAPTGFRIEGISDLINSASHGQSSAQISQDEKSVTIHAEARGHNCYKDSTCVDCPDNWEKWPAYAHRQVQVNLVSTAPTKQVGEEQALMITTRGLCCCPSRPEMGEAMKEFVVSIRPVPAEVSTQYWGQRSQVNYLPSNLEVERPGKDRENASMECQKCTQYTETASSILRDKKYIIRQVNELSNFIRIQTIKSLNDPTVKLQKFIDTEFFSKELEYRIVQFDMGRELLNQSVVKLISREAIPKLERYFKKKITEISRQDLLTLRNEELTNILGIKTGESQKLRLICLGVEFSRDKKSKNIRRRR